MVVLLGVGHTWFGLPLVACAVALGLWLVKEVVLFPFVRVAYEPRVAGPVHDLIGAHGTAQEDLERHGYVRVAHELWRAERVPGAAPVRSGERVVIRDVEGLTLLVEREEADAG